MEVMNILSPQLGTVNGTSFHIVRDLSEIEYSKFKLACRKTKQFITDRELMAIVYMNHDEYQAGLASYLSTLIQRPPQISQDTLGMENMSLNINRLLLNLLFSFRTFLDHTETNLKRRHGKDSAEVKLFKETCSKCYDENFSYRFIYRLRNFAQHCSLPIGGIEMKSSKPSPDAQESHTLEVYFLRNLLLQNFDEWGKQVKSELEAMSERFDINTHVNQMVECLDAINSVLIREQISEASTHAKVIADLVSEVRAVGGNPAIFTKVLLDKSPDGTAQGKITAEWVPSDLIELIFSIEARVMKSSEGVAAR